jgi:hypothetical protein
MAKDALGHGSEGRGAHAGAVARVGLQNPNHPIYNTAQKMRGYNGPISPLTADYSTGGRMLRDRTSGMTKDEHMAAGDQHAQQSGALRAAHGGAVDTAMRGLQGRDPGPLISGIVSDKFSASDKGKLRDLAVGSGKHTSAAFAHYAAAGMRIGTARTRFHSVRGT